jgi:hypothetical protein
VSVSELRHPLRLYGLAANTALTADLLDRFVEVADADLCLELAERDDLSPSQLRALVVRGGADTVVRLVRRRLVGAADVDQGDPEVALALVDEGHAPDSWDRVLADHADSSVRAGVAAAAGVPVDVLTRLAGDPDTHVAAGVALSPALTADVAERLAGHPHLAVRCALARNELTPTSLLAALGTDGSLPPARFCYGCDGTAEPIPGMECRGGHEGALVDLRHAVVENPATPSGVATANVDHPAMWVRWALAVRPDLSQQAYARLAGDPVPGVRGCVAENPAIGEGLIRAMAGDGTYDVRRRLAHNPCVPLDVLADLAPVTRIGPTLLPRIAAATPDEVEVLARSPVAALRMLLAARPDLPPAVVDLLAGDPDAKVLKAVAPNPLLTDRQLRAMVSRHGTRVIAGVARNPTCGPGLLHDLATHVPPVQRAYRTIAAHPNVDAATLLLCLRDHQARPIAARHPALPAATVTALLVDADDRVTEAAAANPSLPRSAIERLLATHG